MSYEQLVQPNLSVVGQPEECLAYVREVFGATSEYPTAAAGWENAQYKHAGEQPPANSVPIWFSYNGPDGHVAVWNNGTIYSTSKEGDKTFPSIQELIDWMNEGFVYLGWSEDVDSKRVVEPAPAPTPPTPSGQTIYLAADNNPFHAYNPGGPYNPNNPADYKGMINPKEFGGLTYTIVKSLGNGIYRITSEDYGLVDIWTAGSDVTVS